jgi:D-alanyl-D-alanine carboxypeptidase/D-alanyl-D-alanine-endopeptidase (penicillin-binding protein 4)
MGEHIQLVDGSGLSGQDRVSPATFVAYLAKFPHTAAGRNFPQLLPANGSGTLRRLRDGLPEAGVVRAKTGTLNDVTTVVGYLGRSKGTLLVSLMYNGKKTTAARKQQWELFRRLGADGVAIPTIADSLVDGEIQLGGESRE